MFINLRGLKRRLGKNEDKLAIPAVIIIIIINNVIIIIQKIIYQKNVGLSKESIKTCFVSKEAPLNSTYQISHRVSISSLSRERRRHDDDDDGLFSKYFLTRIKFIWIKNWMPNGVITFRVTRYKASFIHLYWANKMFHGSA